MFINHKLCVGVFAPKELHFRLCSSIEYFPVARALYEESLGVAREVGDKQGTAHTLCNLGPLLSRQGEYTNAEARLRECLALCRELEDKRVTASALEGCAELAHRKQQLERSAWFYGAAQTLREAIGCPLPPNEREAKLMDIALLREVLNEEAFRAAWEHGEAVMFEQGIRWDQIDSALTL